MRRFSILPELLYIREMLKLTKFLLGLLSFFALMGLWRSEIHAALCQGQKYIPYYVCTSTTNPITGVKTCTISQNGTKGEACYYEAGKNACITYFSNMTCMGQTCNANKDCAYYVNGTYNCATTSDANAGPDGCTTCDGACTGFGKCDVVAGSCVKSGHMSDCTTESCWEYCSAGDAGCSNESCPTYCDYPGGTVNDGSLGTGCSCAKKTCPATAPCCTPTNPDAPVLSNPANAVQVRVNQAVSLNWGTISNWGTGCPTNSNRYEVCVMSGSTCDLVNYVSAGTNTTYSWTPTAADAVVTWKVRSNNGSNTNESGTRTVCVEGGETYGVWSACNASTHKRTRTCTETCGTDDCTAAGAVGGVITQDCVGTIQGALFDASDMTTCPADIISNPGNYSGALIANRSFNMTSPFGPPSWPGVNAATRTLTTNANGFYTVNAYAPGTYTYDFSALAGDYTGVNDPKLKCTSAAAGLPGCSTEDETQPCSAATLPNMSFGFWRVYGGWWQAVGGSVYAETGLKSNIPASVPPLSSPYNNQKLIVSDAGRTGILVHGFNWQGTELGTNPNAGVSVAGYRAQSLYDGLRYDYNFYKTRMDVFPSKKWEADSIVKYDDGGTGFQIFTSDTDVTIGSPSPIVVDTGKKIILLVNGNVNINQDISTATNSFFAVIARGTITYSYNVNIAQGWFVANSISVPCRDVVAPMGTCDKADVQFVGQGSFVGWSGINLNRDMAAAANNTDPSEKFIYRPDMLLNAPTPIRVYSKKYSPFIP